MAKDNDMPELASVLIVDDDRDILKAASMLLRRSFSEVITCAKPNQIPELIASRSFDTVVLDMNFRPSESTGREGMEWLKRILSINPQMVVVMITAHGTLDTAINAMKHGATDFIVKPWQNEKVVATISAAVALGRSRKEAFSLRETNQLLREATSSSTSTIIGSSAAMQAVHSIVERAAPTDANVLILGENGTGKELIARELHRQSNRSDQVFLTVDMGSISETLFESELFGHKKGAFTGATKDRLGRFQAAHRGTLFLDEIGNLPIQLQPKLLGALEQRKVTPVGSDKSEHSDVRIIAATNTPREQLNDETRFRPDLLFRLNTVEVSLPALRDRKGDILLIARHYAEIYANKYSKKDWAFSKDAEQAILRYSWPGNVRSLRHCIERAMILAKNEQIEVTDMQLPDAPLQTNQAMPLNLEQIEKSTVHAALRKHRFNISHAAKELGITRASLYRRMEKHDL